MKWTTKPLAEVAEFRLGKMLDEKKNKGEPLPYLANINVRWGEFDLDNLREMRFAHDEMNRYGLKYGDIVMCEGGEPGRCAIWKESVPGMMIQKALHRIRPHDGLDYRFLFYSLLHKGRIGSFVPLFTGSTIKHLPREKLAKVEIVFPRLDVQCHIADILSGYDDLIENNRRRMALLEESSRLLYREWFVHLRFPGHEHTRITDGVPEGWERKSLGDLCSEIRESVSPENLEPDTPYIGLEHMPRRSISLNDWGKVEEVTSSKNRFKTREILFGKIRPYFHKVGVAFVDGVASSDTIVIRPMNEKLHGLVLMAVSSDEFVAVTAQQMKEGSKMPRADWKQMQSYCVPLPPSGLLSTFDGVIQPIISQLNALTFANQKLRAARDLLLPRLMSGDFAV
ncbi:MAG: restriction endonuclease subunit S [Propionivibrio sp.]|uniref:restriction endonuclease subunit S n=1 Tax=Propionivibrio sp. TaxID=2212460 RepID=UPI001A3E60E0|nr:restriction endonuclease subunit S [Propionivibrio sp.]MBL8413148.1 restriction endonuclease subunit S [Propionivibrio sp.]